MKVDDTDDGESVEIRNATQCHVSNVSVKASYEHDLLHVEGKVNGRRAVMLIDSGSTHDFIAEGFARQHQLLTDVSAGKDLQLTLADGSSTPHRHRDNSTIESHRQRLLRRAKLHSLPFEPL